MADDPSNEATATFRILGDDLDPGEVTSLLGLEPTQAVARGHARCGVSRSGKRTPRPTAKQGGWTLESPLPRSASLGDHLAGLLDHLEPVAERIAALRARGYMIVRGGGLHEGTASAVSEGSAFRSGRGLTAGWNGTHPTIVEPLSESGGDNGVGDQGRERRGGMAFAFAHRLPDRHAMPGTGGMPSGVGMGGEEGRSAAPRLRRGRTARRGPRCAAQAPARKSEAAGASGGTPRLRQREASLPGSARGAPVARVRRGPRPAWRC